MIEYISTNTKFSILYSCLLVTRLLIVKDVKVPLHTPSLPHERGFMRAGSCAWCIAGTHYLLNEGAHHDQASPHRSAKPFRGAQLANPYSSQNRV